MSCKASPHEGHRARMRERLAKTSPAAFADHELLEMLLYYTNARCDTNEIAHSLIETFGSLSGVFDTSYEELMNVKHIGPKTAILLTLFPKLFREYSLDKEMQKVKMENIAQEKHVSLNNLVVQCCEYALNSMGDEHTNKDPSEGAPPC